MISSSCTGERHQSSSSASCLIGWSYGQTCSAFFFLTQLQCKLCLQTLCMLYTALCALSVAPDRDELIFSAAGAASASLPHSGKWNILNNWEDKVKSFHCTTEPPQSPKCMPMHFFLFSITPAPSVQGQLLVELHYLGIG